MQKIHITEDAWNVQERYAAEFVAWYMHKKFSWFFGKKNKLCVKFDCITFSINNISLESTHKCRKNSVHATTISFLFRGFVPTDWLVFETCNDKIFGSLRSQNDLTFYETVFGYYCSNFWIWLVFLKPYPGGFRLTSLSGINFTLLSPVLG